VLVLGPRGRDVRAGEIAQVAPLAIHGRRVAERVARVLHRDPAELPDVRLSSDYLLHRWP